MCIVQGSYRLDAYCTGAVMRLEGVALLRDVGIAKSDEQHVEPLRFARLQLIPPSPGGDGVVDDATLVFCRAASQGECSLMFSMWISFDPTLLRCAMLDHWARKRKSHSLVSHQMLILLATNLQECRAVRFESVDAHFDTKRSAIGAFITRKKKNRACLCLCSNACPARRKINVQACSVHAVSSLILFVSIAENM